MMDTIMIKMCHICRQYKIYGDQETFNKSTTRKYT